MRFRPLHFSLLGLLAITAPAVSSPLFPVDDGVVDVTQAPYAARPDGITDCTEPIQRALAENIGRIIYLPPGTYLIHDTLRWPKTERDTTLWGESRERSIIRLVDAAPGFERTESGKAMLWTGQKPAQRFKNYVRNLTLHVGERNPGAIGAQFISNNTGAFREVTIVAPAGSGAVGLDLGYTDEQGPCLIKNVLIDGFAVGISCRTSVDSVTFEHVTLRNQGEVALRNHGQVVSGRGLIVENAPLAIENAGTSLLTLLDSELRGRGAVAIRNIAPAALFARDVQVRGFATAVRNDSGGAKDHAGDISEYVSHRAISLFPGEGRSLRLPIKETPDVPWEPPGNWVSIAKFGAVAGPVSAGPDCSDAVQRAIDSGAKTIYVPGHAYRVDRDIRIRGRVERIIGLGQRATLWGKGRFVCDEEGPPVLVIEALQGLAGGVEQASTRTFVLRNMAVQPLGFGAATTGFTATNTGEVFLEDVVSAILQLAPGARVWARQINTERQGTHILNDGATLWILGLKTERGGTLIHSRNGARTELCGGFSYTTTLVAGSPMFLIEDSVAAITFRETNFSKTHGPFDPAVRVLREGVTRDLSAQEAPKITGGSLLTLVVETPETPAKRPD